MRKHDSKKIIFALIAALIAAMLFSSSCGSGNAASLDYLDSEITISGLTDDDFTVTVRELTQLESVTEKASATRFNGDEVKFTAVGPTLNTFLAQYDKKQTDFSSIRFTATDKYAIAIPESVLENRDIILAYKDGNKPLIDDDKPLHIIVPGERAMYWERMVCKIEFETGDAAVSTSKVVFLDNALPQIGGEENEEEGGKIVSTAELTETYGGAGSKVTMTASDGLIKKETADNFLLGYIKYTGEKIPQFCSPDLPEGMNVDGVVSIQTGNVIYYSLDKASEVLEERESEGVKGLAFSDMIRDKLFVSSKIYEITDTEGNKTQMAEQEIGMGVFTKDKETWSFYAGAEKYIKNVVMVEGV
jgi:hypothetical protein